MDCFPETWTAGTAGFHCSPSQQLLQDHSKHCNSSLEISLCFALGAVGSHPHHKNFGWFLIRGSVDLHCPKPTRPTHAGNNSGQKKLELCPAQVRFGGEELGWRSGCVPLAAATAHYTSRGDGRRQLPVWLPLPSPHPTAGGAPTWHCGGWERLCTA